MKRHYIPSIIAYLLLIFNLQYSLCVQQKALAAPFLEPETKTLFQLPKEYVIAVKEGLDGSFDIRNSIDSSTGIFHIETSDFPLEKVLDDLRFRSLDAEKLKNREIRGKTAIEAIGKDYEQSGPTKLLLFSNQGKTLAIRYTGDSLSEYEHFVNAIFFPLAPFSDTDGHAFEKEITDLEKLGVMKGYLEADLVTRSFKPEKPITRAEFLKILSLSIADLDEKTIVDLSDNDSVGFTDVAINDWFYPFVQFAARLGWVRGYDDQSFRPHASIRVSEAVKLLVTSRDFFIERNDGSGNPWYQPYFNFLVEHRALNRHHEEYFFPATSITVTPSSEVTRAQAAALIIRFQNVDDEE